MGDLDVNGMVESVKKGEWGVFPDQWLKEHHIKDCQMCAAMANSIPSMVFEECPFGEKWGRIMMFFMCEKKHKYKTCMNHDMKNKLEKSFGSLEDHETSQRPNGHVHVKNIKFSKMLYDVVKIYRRQIFSSMTNSRQFKLKSQIHSISKILVVH